MMQKRTPEPTIDPRPDPAAAPHLSIVIPVFNEEQILPAALGELRAKLAELPWSYEILLAENGSRDRTVALAEELAREAPELHVHSLGEPNYGKALRQGILRARGRFVICEAQHLQMALAVI